MEIWRVIKESWRLNTNSKNLRIRENCNGLKILFKLSCECLVILSNSLICNGSELSRFEWSWYGGSLSNFFFITNLSKSGEGEIGKELGILIVKLAIFKSGDFFSLWLGYFTKPSLNSSCAVIDELLKELNIVEFVCDFQL